ncbi:MAG TPA: hypothetical protein VKB86_20165, partial [Pyrinomonadaceae bacterium]|nr:hypothetical protein [Pyrinomonadaceae bacterium]
MSDDPNSLKSFWELLKRLNRDVKRCMMALQETPEDDEEARSFWRKMYALSVFSLIDGVTYRMMFQAYIARHRSDVLFTPDELIKLKNYYDFDEDREAVMTFSRTQMLEDLKFAFNAFARVHYSDYILPTHDDNWALIKDIARIRNALQFPREASAVEVYEENIDSLVYGLLWLIERMVELVNDSSAALLEKLN